MTRARRAYNRPNRIKDFYHPFHALCCGHCPRCHKGYIKVVWRRKAAERRYMELEIAGREIMRDLEEKEQ